MNIFVINSGSSSLKYQLFRFPAEQPLCSGLVERIGLENSIITHKVFPATEEEQVVRRTLALPDHRAGLQQVLQLLTDAEIGILRAPGEVEVVGHRVVHGGESFAATTIITPEVKHEIRRLFPLAPLHNPANYLGIEVAEQIFPQARQVAVFDTAFHQTLPEHAFRYALPEELYREQGIRVYGFHGTSHRYVAARAAAYLGQSEARLITVHLGNGCSIAAVRGGVSVDTSMGFGPLAGLVMGTRSGDIDPSVIFHLMGQLGYDAEQVADLLNKHSGMLGLTGNSDMRDIGHALEAGDPRAALAYEMYAYRIKKYIGAYAAVLGGLDALIFTAGVGENDALVRRLACQDLGFLGIQLDESVNALRAPGLREINHPESRVKLLIIPTNEELEIAKQCAELLGVNM
ncbi:acetate kinase [Hymenobacter taeanensis]|uniref:Acetate kinase n=1 Tax=Hymenobacter taeanensis TaxID=2735321 RepID=A0A6M6BJN3_9BACT|nr:MULTISPECIES: acetate kinase [Hymenobacter]QJX48262.1 acetate kinase [Hymenobacter taeanensis]UOQ82256.1 acetate kinase [Hymenobacter sp. 5414T-23]